MTVPVIGGYVPALPGPIAADGAVQFDVTIAGGFSLLVPVSVGYPGSDLVEGVYDGYDFEARFKGSTVTAIAGGYRFVLRRQGVWPGNPLLRIRPGVPDTGGSAFDPSQLASCAAWYRADYGVTKDGGNRVSAWLDKSNKTGALTQAMAGHQPLFVASAINTQPGIQFTFARSDALVWSIANPPRSQQGGTWLRSYVVVDLGAGQSGNALTSLLYPVDTPPATGPFFLPSDAGGADKPVVYTRANAVVVSAAAPVTGKHCISFRERYLSGPNATYGVRVDAGAEATASAAWAVPSQWNSLGLDIYSFNGTVCELIMLATAGDNPNEATDDTSVLAYLSTRYGLW